MVEYRKWLDYASKSDKEAYVELASIENNSAEIEDRFYKTVSFGTGGLRGVIGMGTNRMNIYTVGRASAGLGEYVLSSGTNHSVVIAYDSRNMSREFAERAATVLSSKGIKTYVFDKLTPTPVLSFAVRELSCAAGIVITASHNPKEYNGYKVYNEHGCQITDKAAEIISAEIEKQSFFEEYSRNDELIVYLNDDILDKYIDVIKSFSLYDGAENTPPSIVYTPLHGTGNIPVRRVLREIGISTVHVVNEQELPDGNFETCPYPNPEEREALSLAYRDAKEICADMVIATDPDADRVGVVIRNEKDNSYRFLNGNETGILLMNYMLSRKQEQGTLGENPTVIKTIVTTDMAFDIAKNYGASVKEVLTGFKYIGEAMDITDNFVMGMEESYGYLVGKHARDKDAVSAVMLIAEMYAFYKAQGISLIEVLDSLYEIYGYYLTDLVSLTYKGSSGADKMQKIIKAIRENPSIEFDGEKLEFTDFGKGIDGLPASDVLRFRGQNVRVLVRPSGTEPKLKIYYQVKSSGEEQARACLSELKTVIEEILS